jgi:AbrB family looped-hinge helix DNA binding protein
MKIGTVTNTNSKGQLVIPKEIRDALGIDSTVTLNMMLTGKGIYIYPVEEFITKLEAESSYTSLLEKTRGAWNDEDWDKVEKKRSEIELKASESRKNKW